MRRVVVTGFGCLTSAGPNAATTWESVVAGKSAIRTTTLGDAEGAGSRLTADIEDLEPRKLIPDRKLLKVISRQDAIGLNAANQAIEHAEIVTHRDSLDDPTSFNDRTGVFVGSPATKYRQQHDYLAALAAAGGDPQAFGTSAMDEVHPMWLLRTLPNNVLAYVGIGHGFKGANENVTGHGVSGTQAVAEACRYIWDGAIDRAIVVGYDSVSEPEALVYYAAMGLLGSRPVAPFDRDRDGTVLGEGAGGLVLETLDQARDRGAKIYGEVLGCSIVSEGEGILAVREDGDGPARAMRAVLEFAGRGPEEVGMVTAHANGTVASDASEARAINDIFGKSSVPVTGFKWSFGHTVAASGVIESLLTLFALRERRVPGIATLDSLGPDCEGLAASSAEQAPRSALGLVVSRGFAGLNSGLLLSSDVD